MRTLAKQSTPPFFLRSRMAWHSSLLLPNLQRNPSWGWWLLLFGVFLGCRGQRQAANCSEEGSGGGLRGNPSLCGDNATCASSSFLCQCNSGYFSPSGSNTDCRGVDDPHPQCAQYSQQCVFCGSDFQGPCMKCVSFLREAEGQVQCVDACPSGFSITVIPSTSISVRTCNADPTVMPGMLPQWAVILIIVLAVVIVIICVVAGTIFIVTLLGRSSHAQFDVEDTHSRDLRSAEPGGNTLRTRRSNSFSYQKKEHEKPNQDGANFIGHENPSFSDGSDEETEFMQKLDYLRTQAEVFLRMLNDMRRRLKELPPDALAAKQYRNVMRDVTRLLYLLNKRSSVVQMPPDGIQLLSWSEQILLRYQASQGMTTQGVQPVNRLSIIGDQDETHF